jgi:hypothetical protein
MPKICPTLPRARLPARAHVQECQPCRHRYTNRPAGGRAGGDMPSCQNGTMLCSLALCLTGWRADHDFSSFLPPPPQSSTGRKSKTCLDFIHLGRRRIYLLKPNSTRCPLNANYVNLALECRWVLIELLFLGQRKTSWATTFQMLK